ncbi:hypothetical protein HYPSUDRAFT_46450 [Hypholoma sublateritium FD-334 SS-4]|uniref:Transcription factor CBF/NF-Y/archaeal histone domain-containing protein n=1 Tax=Hypholoma sublateritium (strain FD-334 SS-4) TaxID=945553 RepID=A0A0D2M2S9_HYPSF|nr:hypothetical protein HYPSUDRAFT_46450 [Hypholoma sublateritium FD-334 SS-4]
MATTPLDENTQIETQEEEEEEETQYDEAQTFDDDPQDAPEAEEAEAKVPGPKAKSTKEKDREREPGKSLFPFSKVQKIIKADKEIPIVAKEATFLISLATEEFIKRLCQAGQQVANYEKRSTIQHKDIVQVVRQADEFLFLEEVMPLSAPGATTIRRGPKVKMQDHFAAGHKDKNAGEGEGDEDVIMNEDGTMYAAGNVDPGEDEL